ncbi:MAG: gfo/Idh/MocA family oxidoreductase [Alphaproteobacteria bacterium]|nr:gfo/Idh/MocA family oxidoreductase [Alphaproteobacteria bacterium]
MSRLKIGIVGAGKIASDQHAPAIAAAPGLELTGFADPVSNIEGAPGFQSLAEMIRAVRPDAIAVCTPPQVRDAIAREALGAGLHVLLEKPPCATVGALEELAMIAGQAGVTLFTAWHSQHAPAVAAARRWLAEHSPRRIVVEWRENVRRWHPGQQWIWQPGGLGVFDPGINALSILTAVLKAPVRLEQSRLSFPENRATPIAASLRLSAGEAPIEAEFDWRHTGAEAWDIAVEAADGARMTLSAGGHRITAEGETPPDVLEGEYASVYRRFADLIAAGESEVHVEPLRLAADAFLLAERVVVEPFFD